MDIVQVGIHVRQPPLRGFPLEIYSQIANIIPGWKLPSLNLAVGLQLLFAGLQPEDACFRPTSDLFNLAAQAPQARPERGGHLRAWMRLSARAPGKHSNHQRTETSSVWLCIQLQYPNTQSRYMLHSCIYGDDHIASAHTHTHQTCKDHLSTREA